MYFCVDLETEKERRKREQSKEIEKVSVQIERCSEMRVGRLWEKNAVEREKFKNNLRDITKFNALEDRQING